LPTLMFNYGRGFNDDVPRFMGAGIEMASDAIDLFIEASSEPVAGGGFFDATAKARVTPGVRIKIPYFHLNGGVEIGITDSVPDYEAILGFSFVSPFPKPKPKPWGRLAGKVKDSRSGLPLEATISSPNRKFRKLTTDGETGIFYLQKAPTGVIVVEASAEGYIPEAVPLAVTDQGYATYTFELKPLVPYGTVAGRVYDKYTGKPMAAEIRFPESDIAAVEANEKTGFFRTDRVPAGLVGVEAAQAGYFTDQRLVEVEDGGVTRLEFALVAENMKGWFGGKVSDRKTGGALAATVSFTNVQRAALGTDPTAGTFGAELPVGSYEVKVEAEGYLPQNASFTINKGDSTLRSFEMVQKGMVLTLRGVYFEFAKALLRPESFIALNEAAQILKDNPDIRVEIQGHTDSIGSDRSNQTLSERRAYSVVNYLVQYGGIDAQRLVAKGYGEAQPVASNNTEEGRQLNRRVDFVILK
ncbi:MAG: OmpA family protein, partial [bacterium]